MRKRTYSLPEAISRQIIVNVDKYDYRITQSEKLAEMIKDLSDIYTASSDENQSIDIWSRRNHHIAYLCYYYPLNYLRNLALADIARQTNFLAGTKNIYDIGCGPGTAYQAWQNNPEVESLPWVNFDNSNKALELAKELSGSSNTNVKWLSQFDTVKEAPHNLGMFSYSLNEMDWNISFATQFSSLIFLEPATHQDGRRLLKLRQQLIDSGFYIWAPCTHQEACPLLNESKKDWCHDRIHIEMPQWFRDIEKHLPMKNQTITFSYLMAKKEPPPPIEKKVARVTGDFLKEKGKFRQLICRGPKREFLTWLKRDLKPTEIPRGVLVELPNEIEEKGAELRIKVQPSLS